ncbi:MAG TPA: hypothetical protein VLJ76_00350 [Gaiellaceae bacterium]|nr:hypothetical protein [Gaiellaceae bacterium]
MTTDSFKEVRCQLCLVAGGEFYCADTVARIVAAREELEAGASNEAAAILRDLEADLSAQGRAG